MKLEQLLKNMYQFWKSGNSLKTVSQWLKDGYGEVDGKVLMSSFVKTYSHDKELMSEFNKTCFIENIHSEAIYDK